VECFDDVSFMNGFPILKFSGLLCKWLFSIAFGTKSHLQVFFTASIVAGVVSERAKQDPLIRELKKTATWAHKIHWAAGFGDACSSPRLRTSFITLIQLTISGGIGNAMQMYTLYVFQRFATDMPVVHIVLCRNNP